MVLPVALTLILITASGCAKRPPAGPPPGFTPRLPTPTAEKAEEPAETAEPEGADERAESDEAGETANASESVEIATLTQVPRSVSADADEELTYAQAIELGSASVGRRLKVETIGRASVHWSERLDDCSTLWGVFDEEGEFLGFVGHSMGCSDNELTEKPDPGSLESAPRALVRGTIARYEPPRAYKLASEAPFADKQGSLLLLKDIEIGEYGDGGEIESVSTSTN